MQMLTNRNSLSPTYVDEIGHVLSSFERALVTAFLKELPLLLFVQGGTLECNVIPNSSVQISSCTAEELFRRP